MFDFRGNVKVVDFGISVLIEEKTKRTMVSSGSTVKAGTPLRAAPDNLGVLQIRGATYMLLDASCTIC